MFQQLSQKILLKQDFFVLLLVTWKINREQEEEAECSDADFFMDTEFQINKEIDASDMF